MTESLLHEPAHERSVLRKHLIERRREWLSTPASHAADAALARQLHDVLMQLEPLCLGLYWPLPGEFNASTLLHREDGVQWALPFAYKSPRRMEYRLWQPESELLKDECGIDCAHGPVVMPDVVLVPCVGFTREGYRMGYGGGYFDRWLAEHPGVTSVGVAWSVGETSFPVEPHDQPLTVILTEGEVIAP
ncbi:5-formyltetrahydrofolate cyclo-ligase [Burkholderiaceae bacterium UC74_6]